MEALLTVSEILILVGILIGLMIFLRYVPLNLWITAIFSGVRLKLLRDLLGMRLRKVPPAKIVRPLIMANKAGIHLEAPELEGLYLAGGNIENVVLALISADKANIELSFARAAAIDLAGRDVFEAVQMSVNPKVIETPLISAMAKDGIQVRATARVTLRASIDRLVGGAGVETVLARVGEGIVTTIGSSNSHKDVLENPDKISETVLSHGLEVGTAFEVLSIDIADVDIGENIGARLQSDRAEADLKIARAKAEERRAEAVAHEQEMHAKVAEEQARVVAAQAEVPLAMADVFRHGKRV